MLLTRVRIRHFRSLYHCDWQPVAGLNVITGPNGIGKTSLLEAIFFLSSGKSFRGGGVQNLISHGQSSLSVYAESQLDGNPFRMGVSKDKQGTVKARLQEDTLKGITPISLLLPVVAIHSDSYQFVDSGPETKRRFLDWMAFHVKPRHLLVWKNYRYLLQQTNGILKNSRSTDQERYFWYEQLAEVGETLDQHRKVVFEALEAQCEGDWKKGLLQGMGLALHYRPGWKTKNPLLSELISHDEQNRRYGAVMVGPHRMDIRVISEGGEARKILSRGQKKLLAIDLHLSQLQLIHQSTRKWPLVCLDDMDAELDQEHLQYVFERFKRIDTQVFASSLHPRLITEKFPSHQETKVFHVKHDLNCGG